MNLIFPIILSVSKGLHYYRAFNYFRTVSSSNCTEWLMSKFMGIHKFI